MRIVFMQGIWRVVILAVFMFPLPDCVAQEPGPIAPSVAVLLEKRYVAVFPDRSKILFVVSQDERVSPRSGDGILERSVGDVLHVSGDTGSDLDLVIRKINRDSFEMDVQNGSIVSGVQHVTMPFSPAWKIAAYRGNVDGLRKILDSGFDVNSKDGVGRTALMVAGSYGHYDAVRLLLEHNAKTVIEQKSGATALRLSLAFPEIVRLLVDHGAIVQRGDLYRAAYGGYAESMAILLCSVTFDPNVENQSGVTVYAACSDKPSITALCDKYGVRPSTKEFLSHVKSGEVQRIRNLLDAGMDCNVRDAQGMTALMYATTNLQVFRLLAERGADINVRDFFGMTVLDHVLVDGGRNSVDMIEILQAGNVVISDNARARLRGMDRQFPGNEGVSASARNQRIRKKAQAKFEKGKLYLDDAVASGDPVKVY